MNCHGTPWEIIFVNDGSLDRSEEILDRLATLHSEVKVVHFRRNFGQTAAMMAGFDFASGDVIIPMDGDGQNDPEDIPRMLAKIEEGYDVCSGWRRDRQDNAIQRNIPSILANKLISAVSGVRLHDFGCSLKAYRAEVLEGIRLYGEMHRFLPIYAKWHGARIAEIPVNHHALHGFIEYGLERVLKVLMDLVTVKFMDKFMLKPMYLFGLWGVLFFAAAFGFSVDPLHAHQGILLYGHAAADDGGLLLHDRGDLYSDGLTRGNDHAHVLRVSTQVDLSRSQDPQHNIISEGGLNVRYRRLHRRRESGRSRT